MAEEEIGEITGKMKEFLRILEVVRPSRFLTNALHWCGDAEDIKNFSRKLGHVPIIDINNAEVMRYRFLLPKSADTVNVPA